MKLYIFQTESTKKINWIVRYYRNFNIVEFTKNRRGENYLEYFFKFNGKLGFKSWLHYYTLCIYMEILIRKVELFQLVSFV